MFKNRLHAGVALAAKLRDYRHDPGVVLAVPRGGVPVAYVVAKELHLPIEIVLTKKIGHPLNKEYAIGAANLTDYFVEPHDDVDEQYIGKEVELIRRRLREMYRLFMGDTEPETLTGKTVIVIDDGMATGHTMLATIQVLKKSKPGKIVVGVPVASREAVRAITGEADEVVAVLIPESFHGVGEFYEDFSQLTDEDVKFYLNQLKGLRKTG